VPETGTDDQLCARHRLGSAGVSSPDNVSNPESRIQYFHKRRNAFERVARDKLALGEIDYGEIHLTML
jgi:hypothetical protein